MKLRGKEKLDLEKVIQQVFPGCSFDENAPQGQNNFSSNYLLKDRKGKQYLLKVILRKRIKGNINQEQAFSEVSVCKSIHSPYVVSLCYSKQDDNYIFLQFPYLEGLNLKDYANGRIFNESEIIEIGVSLLRGISDLWRKRIVHQDIKPENIFIERTNDLKILDFGSARFQISPFRGTARTNFAYSAPEQILASRPSNIESQRITLDDRTDVYAVGLILYSLIEGGHPFKDEAIPAEAIFSGKRIPDFTRTNISDGIKKVILSMLDINLLNRPNAQTAISYFEAGDVTMPELQNGGFYYCAIKGTSRFLKIKEKTPNLFDGIVVDASQIPAEAAKRAEIRKDIKTVIIDPQTYLFQSPQHQSKRFKKLPYFKYSFLFDDMPKFLEKAKNGEPDIVNFINDVVNYQFYIGATTLTPPFLYIEEFNDETWGIDQEITHVSLNYLPENYPLKHIIKGVAISQEILTSDHSRGRVLEYLTSLSDKVEGYIVLLDSMHSEIVSNEPWLKGAQDLFIKLLSTGKYVIWSRADFSGLLLAHTGVSIAMGEMLKQRRFNIVEDRQTGGSYVPHFYISALFARATWPDVLKPFSKYEKYDQLLCTNKCCANINFRAPISREEVDLASHMMQSVAEQFKKYKGGSGRKALVKDIKVAKQHYDLLKNNPDVLIRGALRKNVKPSTGSFLDSWLNTLN